MSMFISTVLAHAHAHDQSIRVVDLATPSGRQVPHRDPRPRKWPRIYIHVNSFSVGRSSWTNRFNVNIWLPNVMLLASDGHSYLVVLHGLIARWWALVMTLLVPESLLAHALLLCCCAIHLYVAKRLGLSNLCMHSLRNLLLICTFSYLLNVWVSMVWQQQNWNFQIQRSAAN